MNFVDLNFFLLLQFTCPMRRAASVTCRPPSRVSVRASHACAAPRTATAAPTRFTAPSSLILRHLATRAAPPPSGSRPAPPSRGTPPPRAPPQPQGVYTGSDFARKPDVNKPNAKPAGASPAIVDLTPLNVEEYLMRSPVPVIVDCYADWCGAS